MKWCINDNVKHKLRSASSKCLLMHCTHFVPVRIITVHHYDADGCDVVQWNTNSKDGLEHKCVLAIVIIIQLAETHYTIARKHRGRCKLNSPVKQIQLFNLTENAYDTWTKRTYCWWLCFCDMMCTWKNELCNWLQQANYRSASESTAHRWTYP